MTEYTLVVVILMYLAMYVESVQNVFQHILFSITGKQTKFTRILNGACLSLLE